MAIAIDELTKTTLKDYIIEKTELEIVALDVLTDQPLNFTSTDNTGGWHCSAGALAAAVGWFFGGRFEGGSDDVSSERFPLIRVAQLFYTLSDGSGVCVKVGYVQEDIDVDASTTLADVLEVGAKLCHKISGTKATVVCDGENNLPNRYSGITLDYAWGDDQNEHAMMSYVLLAAQGGDYPVNIMRGPRNASERPKVVVTDSDLMYSVYFSDDVDLSGDAESERKVLCCAESDQPTKVSLSLIPIKVELIKQTGRWIIDDHVKSDAEEVADALAKAFKAESHRLLAAECAGFTFGGGVTLVIGMIIGGEQRLFFVECCSVTARKYYPVAENKDKCIFGDLKK